MSLRQKWLNDMLSEVIKIQREHHLNDNLRGNEQTTGGLVAPVAAGDFISFHLPLEYLLSLGITTMFSC